MTTKSSDGIGRNRRCPCGSGRKFKTCCGRLASATPESQATSRPPPDGALRPLVEMLQLGRCASLEAAARALLAQRPTLGPAWQLLAEALRRQGKDPLPALVQAAQCLPHDAVAQLNAGNALGRAGRLDAAEACLGRAIELAPDLAEAHNGLGILYLELGRYDAAVAHCRRAVELKPDLAADCAATYNTAGAALQQAGHLDEAIAHFRRALELDPRCAEAQLNLANALRSIGRLDEAEAGCRGALRLRPDFVPALTSLGTALRLQGRGTEAEASCRTALQLEPRSTEALAVLAELQADHGRFAAAEELYRRALAIDPQSAESWAGIVRLRRMTPQDTDWLAAARNLLRRELAPPREMALRFALGKYFDDVGSFDEAFENYRCANELARRLGPPHDRASLSRTVDLLLHFHDHAWFERMRAAASLSQQPVLIVGMLRSGTSLAEQILASHPQVFGAGEISFWGPAFAPALTGALERDAAPDLDAAVLHGWGADYHAVLQRAAREAPRAPRVVDKLPTNFLHLGLIHAAFPRARILHLRRNPLDTCLSIYFQRFESANTYANDLEDLGHYHHDYRRLMRHWHGVLPAGALLDVPYEELVADPEDWSRRMVEFIGLPWDPRCLDFHRHERAVVTASRWQVRQTINTASVGRWRHYARHLGPLRACLDGDEPRDATGSWPLSRR